jgi:plasmid stabilization system protein ParE
MRAELSGEALADFGEAIDWYLHELASDAAADFADEFDDALVMLAAFPELGMCLRGEIGAGVGLRVALAPPDAAREDVGQEALLLRVVAKIANHGADHAEPAGHDAGRTGQRALGRKNVSLHWDPARAAMFDRPVDAGLAAGRERLLPADMVFACELQFVLDLVADVGWAAGDREVADVLLESDFLRAESVVHACCSEGFGGAASSPAGCMPINGAGG